MPGAGYPPFLLFKRPGVVGESWRIAVDGRGAKGSVDRVLFEVEPTEKRWK